MEYANIMDVLDDSLGRFYFKKYAGLHFLESAVACCIQLEEFRHGNFTTPVAGSHIWVVATDTSIQLMRKRAQRIVKKFLHADGRMQVCDFVAAADRAKLIEVVDAKDGIGIEMNTFDGMFRDMRGMLHDQHLKPFLESRQGQVSASEILEPRDNTAVS